MTQLGSDPRQVTEATVLKAGVPAATLGRDSAGVVFRYRDEYLAAQGRPVATTLPLTDEPLRTPGRSVPPFFANLLPEGRRLTALRRSVKTSAEDELSLLIAVGSDPVGDVQVMAPEAEAASPRVPADTSLSSFAELDFTELLSEAGVGDPSALAGVQDKVSGRMLTLPLAHQGRSVLLKLEVPEYPEVIFNEAYFLIRARALRHPVVAAEVVQDRHGRPGLLVTRFDRRVAPDGSIESLAVEDGAQLLGRYPADKYGVTAEEVAAAVREVCSARPLALRAWLIQVSFAWLTGNGDLHAKNVSVLRTEGEWRVAPIYDIPSTVPYRDTTLALTVGARDSGLSRRSLTAFGVEIGLPERAVQATIDHVLQVTDGLADDVAAGALPFDPQRQRDLVRTLRQRHRALS